MKSIYDVMKCPGCGNKESVYRFSTNDIAFYRDNTGYYSVNCHCEKCNINFRLFMHFEYNITEVDCR